VFYPVPRVDRWDGVIGGVVAVLIVTLLAASFLVSR
jgi:hypothetical protein